MIAAFGGHTEIVELLLWAGADRERVNTKGETSLYFAVSQDHVQVVRLLFSASADKDKANNNGSTPLCRATANGNVELVRLLLKAQQTQTVGECKWDSAFIHRSCER